MHPVFCTVLQFMQMMNLSLLKSLDLTIYRMYKTYDISVMGFEFLCSKLLKVKFMLGVRAYVICYSKSVSCEVYICFHQSCKISTACSVSYEMLA